MMPCNHCGAENPLGTMFCRSCGERIEANVGDVMASVKDTKAHQRDVALMGYARSALSLAIFLFFGAGVVNWIMVPDLPPVSMPAAEPMTIDEMLPMAEEHESGSIELALGSTDNSLIDWRRANAANLLSEIGADTSRIRAWQRQVLATQEDSGAFAGEDVIGSTALACLALQALPGDPELDAAARAGRDYLHARQRRVLDGSDRRRTLLWGLALWEDERLDGAQRSTIVTLAGTTEADWGALVLPLMTRGDQGESIPLLERELGHEPLWLAYLDLFSNEALLEADAADRFVALSPGDLDAFQRWVWAQTAWWHADDPKRISGIIAQWSVSDDIAPLPVSANGLGDHAVTSLAVLAATAPARAPATAIAQRE